MKVCLRKISKSNLSDSIDVIKDFCQLLQDELKLRKDVYIHFENKRNENMTTGVRVPESEIFVLCKGRLLIDILRTLAHEWVHEHQKTILKRPNGPNIGGQNEDEANAFAGRLVKMFEKEYHDLEPMMYESKSIESKINLLTEPVYKGRWRRV